MGTSLAASHRVRANLLRQVSESSALSRTMRKAVRVLAEDFSDVVEIVKANSPVRGLNLDPSVKTASLQLWDGRHAA